MPLSLDQQLALMPLVDEIHKMLEETVGVVSFDVLWDERESWEDAANRIESRRAANAASSRNGRSGTGTDSSDDLRPAVAGGHGSLRRRVPNPDVQQGLF